MLFVQVTEACIHMFDFKKKHLQWRKHESLGLQKLNGGGAQESDRQALCVFIIQEIMLSILSLETD